MSGTIGLEADVQVRRSAFALSARLRVAPGETVALLGRNGAGKSTLLAAVAGVLPLAAGRVVLDGVVLDDPGAARFVPTERRRVGVVLQQVALFPHLTVLDNVAFGLRTAGMRRAPARGAAAEALERHGLDALAGRRPVDVSGGQAARVALVRALVRRPALLLLDEPLAAIDADARGALRERLAADLADFGGAAVLVTHDAADADALATRAVVLDAGRVLQAGSPADLRAAPVAPVVARLLGPTGE